MMSLRRLIRALRIPIIFVGMLALLIFATRWIGTATGQAGSSCLSFGARSGLRASQLLLDTDSGMWIRFKPNPSGQYREQTSPDGKYAVYSKYTGRVGTGAIQIKNVRTGQIFEITGVSLFGQIKWSPDGKHLGIEARRDYSTGAGFQYIMIIANADGTESHIVNTPGFTITSLEWSPDSIYIASKGLYSFVMVNTSDLSVHRTTSGRDIDSSTYLNWSPGGHQLAYVWGRPSKHLSVFDPDTDSEQTSDLPATANYWASITWSPDSRYIALISARTNLKSMGQLSIYDLQDPDGFQETEVGQIPFNVGDIWWLPNSGALIFIQAGQNALVAYHPDTKQYEIVIPNGTLALYSLSSANAVAWWKASNKVTVEYFDDTPSLHGQTLLDDLDEMRFSYWLPEQHTMLLGVRRGNSYSLETVNIITHEHGVLLKDLSDAPSLEPSYTDRSQVAFWWQAGPIGGLSLYSIAEQQLITYKIDTSQRTIPYWSVNGGRAILSPDKRLGVFIVPEVAHQSSIQIGGMDGRNPIILSRGSQTDGGLIVWSPDSSKLTYSSFSAAGMSLDIVDSAGRHIQSLPPVFGLANPVWSACEQFTAAQ